MSLRRFSDYILRGRAQAIAPAFALGFVPLVGLFSSLIGAFVTLRKGALEGALVFVAAMLPTLIEYNLTVPPQHGLETAVSPLAAVILVIAINLLTWVAALILRATTSWSVVLDGLGLLGVAAIVVLHLCIPDLTVFWKHWLTDYFTSVAASTGTEGSASTVTSMADGLKDYATGVVILMASLWALLLLLVARWWQDAVFNPGGLRKEILAVRLSKACAIVFIACVIGCCMHMSMAQDAIMVLVVTFSLSGLSVMQYALSVSHTKWWMMMLVYLLFCVFPMIGVLLIVAGLLDAFFDFRKRLPVKV
jgi:hypothetical protein